MPLIVMVGHPCAGKTRRSLALQSHFSELGHEVMIINHESINLPRSTMYASNEAEKKGRSTLKSTLERFLSAKKIVIFDYLNSIKGYRYELWCRAREVQTQCVTIWCDTPIDKCEEFHSALPEADQYAPAVFKDLIQRMEAPNAEKRWDQPLFRVEPEEDLPLEQISDALLKGKIPAVNQAVVPQRMEESNYLFELDRITQEIIRSIIDRQSSSSSEVGIMVGDTFRVPHATVSVVLARRIHLPELRRIQAQYLKLARIRTPDDAKGIANSFVEHVNMCLRQAQV